MRAFFALSLVMVFAAGASAQPERYELGQRLKAFEKQWDKTADEKLKLKAAAALPPLTALFFANQFGEAGKLLDEARWILEGKKPTDAERWATSLYAVPPSRCYNVETGDYEVKIEHFYPVKGDRPPNLEAQLSFAVVDKISLFDAKEIPGSVTFPMKVGPKESVSIPAGAISWPDVVVRFTAKIGNEVAFQRDTTLSFHGSGLAPALAEIAKFSGEHIKKDTVESATIRDQIELLTGLSKGTVQETDYPLEPILLQLNEIVARNKKTEDYFKYDRPGQFWLSFPTGKSTTPARLFVPRNLDPKKPVPLVVALHGAGGTENLFFEGYGDGQIVKLCNQRGWLLVAPRSAFGFGGGPPVGEIVDQLAKRYPVNPKAVFVVGHSMGAMQAIDAVQTYPGKFAGVAALGGGGRVRKPELFAELPTFLGVGDKDFALAQSKSLNKVLADAKAKKLNFKEYPGLEHLLICREALPDAFALFDDAVKK